MTLRTDRPPVRARSGRRPLPPLIFLLVLAIAAAAVWWNVIRQDDARQAHQAAACASTKAPPSMDPKSLSIRVLNATDRAGEATRVAQALKARGFVISEVANDASGRTVTGVGEIRYGARGKDAAAYLGTYLPGAGDYQDTRATSQVDLVIGPDFSTLASPEQVAAALTPAAASGC